MRYRRGSRHCPAEAVRSHLSTCVMAAPKQRLVIYATVFGNDGACVDCCGHKTAHRFDNRFVRYCSSTVVIPAAAAAAVLVHRMVSFLYFTLPGGIFPRRSLKFPAANSGYDPYAYRHIYIGCAGITAHVGAGCAWA